MAARWRIDHDKRLVEVVLNGETTIADTEDET